MSIYGCKTKLLEKAEQRQVVILPVILETCGVEETRLKRYQAVNPPSRPLRRMKPDERNEVWQRVVRQIKDALAVPAAAPNASEPEPEPAPAETSPGSVQGSLLPSLSSTSTRPIRQGSTRDKFPGLLRELITSTPGLIPYSNYSWKKTYTSFIPQEWDVPALAGKNRWVLIFTFDRKSDRLQLNLIINPGPLETRQRLLDMAHAKQPPFEPVHRQLNDEYNTIYRRMFLTPQAYKNSSEAEVQAEIRKHWKDFLERDLPQIQAAMRSEAWIWK